jgi:hypothetical protein
MISRGRITGTIGVVPTGTRDAEGCRYLLEDAPAALSGNAEDRAEHLEVLGAFLDVLDNGLPGDEGDDDQDSDLDDESDKEL